MARKQMYPVLEIYDIFVSSGKVITRLTWRWVCPWKCLKPLMWLMSVWVMVMGGRAGFVLPHLW